MRLHFFLLLTKLFCLVPEDLPRSNIPFSPLLHSMTISVFLYRSFHPDPISNYHLWLFLHGNHLNYHLLLILSLCATPSIFLSISQASSLLLIFFVTLPESDSYINIDLSNVSNILVFTDSLSIKNILYGALCTLFCP